MTTECVARLDGFAVDRTRIARRRTRERRVRDVTRRRRRRRRRARGWGDVRERRRIEFGFRIHVAARRRSPSRERWSHLRRGLHRGARRVCAVVIRRVMLPAHRRRAHGRGGDGGRQARESRRVIGYECRCGDRVSRHDDTKRKVSHRGDVLGKARGECGGVGIDSTRRGGPDATRAPGRWAVDERVVVYVQIKLRAHRCALSIGHWIYISDVHVRRVRVHAGWGVGIDGRGAQVVERLETYSPRGVDAEAQNIRVPR